MRVVSALLFIAAVFKSTTAANPGNDALRLGLSDAFETAIQKEYGPVIFDSLAASSCNIWKCGITVVKTTPCLLPCVALRSPSCVFKCISEDKLCPCFECFPDDIVNFLRRVGICRNHLNAELFSKVYLGLASDDEKARAQELGYTVSTFATHI